MTRAKNAKGAKISGMKTFYSRLVLFMAILLVSACAKSYKSYGRELNCRAHRAEVIAEREVRRREGWQHSTVFSRGFHDGYLVMVLGSDDTLKGKMLVGPSVCVDADSQGKIVNYIFFPPHN